MRELDRFELKLVSGGENPTFNIINDDGTDRQKLNQALSYLQQSGVASSILDSNDTVNVRIVHSTHDEEYDQDTNTISWDPDHGQGEFDLNHNEYGIQSAALTFFHEYYHSQDAGLSNPANETHFFPDSYLGEAGFTNLNEVHAVEVTNLVAADLGEVQRVTYFGSDANVSSVTDNFNAEPLYDSYGFNDFGAGGLVGYFGSTNSDVSSGYFQFVDNRSGGSYDYFEADGGGYDYNPPRS